MAPAVSLGNTIGAAFLGVIAAAILFGITNLQVFLYFQHYRNDWKLQKIAVGVLWFLDTFHLALIIHAVYHYVIESFGNGAALDLVVWSFKLQIAVNVVVIILVQTQYAIRVWRFGRHFKLILPSIVIAAVAIGYGIGIVLAVKTYHVTRFSQISEISWAVYSSFATSTAIDVIITGVMFFYLHRSRSGFSETNSKIVAIMRYVLASGFATALCSMTALITYAAMPNNMVFLGVEFLLTKLYINSFIAMLNARQSVRDKDASTASTSLSKMMNVRSGTSSGAVHVSSSLASPVNDKFYQNAIHLSPLDYHLRYDSDPMRRGQEASRSFLGKVDDPQTSTIDKDPIEFHAV